MIETLNFISQPVLLIKAILATIIIFLTYRAVEVNHDYSVSKDSKGTKHNKIWHRTDAWSHLNWGLVCFVLTFNIFFAFLVWTTRAFWFDKFFSKKWHNDYFYVGENEWSFKKKNPKLFFYGSLLLWIINVILIFKYFIK